MRGARAGRCAVGRRAGGARRTSSTCTTGATRSARRRSRTSKATGIKVVYQEFDSNETLQAKLLSGTSGYDVVVPSDIFWARQLQAGIYRKIDKSQVPNYGLLDPEIMKVLAKDDPGNQFGIPWTWGTDEPG